MHKRNKKPGADAASSRRDSRVGIPYSGPVTFADGEPDFLVGQDPEIVDMGGPRPRQAFNLLTALDAARFLHLDAAKLDDLVAEGWPIGPGYFLVNGREFFALLDLEDWLYARRLDATAVSGGADA